MKAPFKRGTKLVYNGRLGKDVVVTYRKWWGIMRSALIVVEFPCGRCTTVHVNEVKEMKS